MSFCCYCGRQMVDVVEPGLFDPDTGQRETVVWRECPKFSRHGVRNLLAAFRCHQSYQRDNPIHGREYR